MDDRMKTGPLGRLIAATLLILSLGACAPDAETGIDEAHVGEAQPACINAFDCPLGQLCEDAVCVAPQSLGSCR